MKQTPLGKLTFVAMGVLLCLLFSAIAGRENTLKASLPPDPPILVSTEAISPGLTTPILPPIIPRTTPYARTATPTMLPLLSEPALFQQVTPSPTSTMLPLLSEPTVVQRVTPSSQSLSDALRTEGNKQQVIEFNLIPVVGPRTDRPDRLHGDLNLSQRSYNPVDMPLALVDISGNTGPNPPQLPGLFGDDRLPVFTATYQVNDWNWVCDQHGCRGGPLSNWPVTLLGLETTPGEQIFIPSRPDSIYRHNGKNYKALVLYADENRITLNYTREDTVARGYSVHLENICVDSNLLSLYRSQVDQNGYRKSNQLPGLTDDQSLGTANATEIQVAVRADGTFMDPRSRKDWWSGK